MVCPSRLDKIGAVAVRSCGCHGQLSEYEGFIVPRRMARIFDVADTAVRKASAQLFVIHRCSHQNNQKMKIVISALLVAISSGAFAEQDPAFCKMAGALAQGIAQDRERGVPYKVEIRNIDANWDGSQSTKGILALAKSAVKTVYLDMPKLSPEGAYKLYYVACMAAN